MSAQQITRLDVNSILNDLDDFLIGEGRYFVNIVDYDLKGKIDHNKIDILLKLKKIPGYSTNPEILEKINQILQKQ